MIITNLLDNTLNQPSKSEQKFWLKKMMTHIEPIIQYSN